MMNKRKGFTLLEIVVALFVATMLLGAVYMMFIRVYLLNKQQQDFVKVQDSLRTSGLQLESDIRHSSQYLVIGSVGSCYVLEDTENATDTTYCLNNHSLSRNGVTLIDNIEEFVLVDGDIFIDIFIKGNYDGKELTHEKRIYLRTP